MPEASPGTEPLSPIRVSPDGTAGKVLVEGKKDGPVEVLATIHAESEALLAELPIDVSENGGAIEVIAKYPVEKHSAFRYPGNGWSGSTSTTYLGHRVKVGSWGVPEATSR